MPAGSASTEPSQVRAPLGVLFALVLTLITATFMVVAPLVVLNTDPVVFGEGLASQKQDAETLIYLVTFLILLPFWLWQGPRIAERLLRRTGADGLSALTAALAGLLAAAIALVRVSDGLPWGDGIRAILAAGIVWWLITTVVVYAASKDSFRGSLKALGARSKAIWLVTAGLTLLAVLAQVRFGHVDPLILLIGLLVAVAVGLAYGRFALPNLSRGWKLAIDGFVVLLIMLAIPDMVIIHIEDARAGNVDAISAAYIIPFHQDLWLGAASQVLGGSALLVDTVSQYGIAPIYLIAAFFKIAPISGTALGFFDAVLSAGVFATGYLILRMAGVKQLLATIALAVGVIALVWDLTYPMGGLLQHGALRFGLPILVVAFQVAGARWERFSRAANLLSLAVVGLSSVWALEAFLYVSTTWLALLLLRLTWQPRAERLRWLVIRIGEVLAAWIITQVLFALVTLLASGSLPDWGLYLSYLRGFLSGGIGDLTYDVTHWTRGFALAGLYIASAIGLTLLSTRASDFVLARKPAMVALAALTGYGIGLYSYYDNRSLDHILPYISLPALLLATIWLTLCLESEVRFSLLLRRCALGVACGFAALMVAVAFPAAGTRSKDSLLAYVIPGGPSLSSGFDRIWHPPEIAGGSVDGEQLIARYMPGDGKVAVLTRPDLDNEILARSDRINSLGITDAKEMSWVPGPHEGTIDDAVAEMKAGDLMIVDNETIIAYTALEKGTAKMLNGYVIGSKMEPIQIRAIEDLRQRFRFKVVARRPSGVAVVRLEPR